ncbi:uncharacterized protein FFB20_08967 [Fusarium fujikuroi]|uniref:Mucin n=1 Tax=Gibberella fujikuroi (strain CBS 195.34 / IMI 58289 / NRRL A-6831) TaxID=1279085 RepID=S0DJ47_GIBF5|nr:uncharacterized protein FFUJ_01140 [Fusarium fujikuroi IMI 58289]KLP03096.1 uncharacterized protein LW94_6159 [Fusarium fujikuroi]QGI58777.1 hypothetical protein CEK27_000902 [Fusarium fujikuroi]QGI75994.1 hypothetical protein CEK25_000900 [Fusarium fujikuroi]QGI89687.1 hypothetical protein CEK26_000902 [Fusarium fujikuroi]CCT62320.1 uncharacterized protein FFUJ_01140 [Fusarium fujikuroi IMI 58289]
MSQGDGIAALDSTLGWNEDQCPNRAEAVVAIDSNSMNARDSGSVNSQGPGRPDDIMSFFDNETLSSGSASLSQPLYPRPLHHYPHQTSHINKSRIHAQPSQVYTPIFETMHSLQRPKPPLQPQRQRRVPTRLDPNGSTDTSAIDQSQGLGDHSFLLPSRPMSIATTDVTPTKDEPTCSSSLYRAWAEEEQIELRIHSETNHDTDNLRHNSQYHDLLSEIDTECLFPDDSLTADHRPSSSRSHLLQWRRSPSAAASTASKHQRVSSDVQPPTTENRPSATITRQEFEALPPTIQRKYFSTIERSQLAQSPDLGNCQRPGSVGQDQLLSPWPSLPKPRGSYEHQERPITSDDSILRTDRPRITETDQKFYANLPEKIKRRHLTEEELQLAYKSQNTFTYAPEAVSNTVDIPPQEVKMPSPLPSPGLSEGTSPFPGMLSRQNDRAMTSSDIKRSDSFYDSFRWLDDEEGLDLRLYLDDYHINLREEIPVPNKSRRPSFRRHLSINKLPFGKPSVNGLGEGPASPTTLPPSASHSSSVGSSGHVRKKSRARALSLISANRQTPLASPSPLTPPLDPSAAHYRDPEARRKLRAYLASPQKFDEAIEFGFSSKDGPRPHTGFNKASAYDPDRLRSFLEDDRSSRYSDDASAAEPDSPKTPQLFDKTPHIRSLRSSNEHSSYSRGEKSIYDPAASREMTLRMTLTRPDLRQSEDQIYGWKQAGSRVSSSRGDHTPSPALYAREGNPKQSIERQLAALDQWEDPVGHDNRTVKRFWNRVKRS